MNSGLAAGTGQFDALEAHVSWSAKSGDGRRDKGPARELTTRYSTGWWCVHGLGFRRVRCHEAWGVHARSSVSSAPANRRLSARPHPRPTLAMRERRGYWASSCAITSTADRAFASVRTEPCGSNGKTASRRGSALEQATGWLPVMHLNCVASSLIRRRPS